MKLLWSRWLDSNPQPADYKSAALPLSYTGIFVLPLISVSKEPKFFGALGRNRTTDRQIFSLLLYQLSYQGKRWRPRTGSNRRPPAWQAGALTNWATGPLLSNCLVGLHGFEPRTNRLWADSSNQAELKARFVSTSSQDTTLEYNKRFLHKCQVFFYKKRKKVFDKIKKISFFFVKIPSSAFFTILTYPFTEVKLCKFMLKIEVGRYTWSCAAK